MPQQADYLSFHPTPPFAAYPGCRPPEGGSASGHAPLGHLGQPQNNAQNRERRTEDLMLAGCVSQPHAYYKYSQKPFMTMNVLLRSSRCLLRRVAPQGYHLPSQITDECRPRTVEAAALLTLCMYRDHPGAFSSASGWLVGFADQHARQSLQWSSPQLDVLCSFGMTPRCIDRRALIKLFIGYSSSLGALQTDAFYGAW